MRLWLEQMSQAGRTAQTPPSCALGKVLAEDRNGHAGPQRVCELLRPQWDLTSQSWPPGQLNLRQEVAGKPQKDQFLIQLIPKRGTRKDIQTGLERGEETEERWNPETPGTHSGCGSELCTPNLSRRSWAPAWERTELAAPETYPGAQLEDVPHLPWHG